MTVLAPKDPKANGYLFRLLGSIRSRVAFAIVCLVVISAVIVVLFLGRDNNTVLLGNQKITFETVSTDAAREQGLSGRKQMAEHEGMLFVFDDQGDYCFWMKDMYFTIDMIWLDEAKRVVTIKRNAAPASYPESFCPDTPAKYVLEVKAGVADKARLTTGTQLNF